MIYVITGPTGTGKSPFAIDLAKIIKGEIINADAFQIYRGMDIGTNKTTQEQTQGIKHHIIDIVNPDIPYSVADYQNDLRITINQLQNRNIPIIIVGGTGLYIKAGLYDFVFHQKKKQVDMTDLISFTNEQLHQYLLNIDPLAASTIHPNNRRRIMRAIEIYRESGISKTNHIAKQDNKMLYKACFIGFKYDREKLYRIVEKRVDKMFDDGLINEVSQLIKIYGVKPFAFQAIGYKEVVDYLQNKCSLNEAIDNVKLATRRYIKRQMSYFNHQLPINWFTNKEEAFQYVKQIDEQQSD
jgi:tRNA dimethylallyltransferase